MKERVRARALELGFDECRFTTAKPPASATQFKQWLAQERHGQMEYLARNAAKRADLGLVLRGVRSVVLLAASYFHPDDESPPPGHGLIARYACYPDYHQLLAEPLGELSRFIDQLGGAGTRSLGYVDTGPVLERDLAQRAGVGFIGKHTNLINRRLGNWIFLAEILTTLPLAPDPEERNRCGHCTRCLAACPTQAIRGPFELDARLCISYLTIELRGSIPMELRPAIGLRVFGCDDCLEVCPWNRFARQGRIMREGRRRDLQLRDLVDLLELDEAGFRTRFRSTPLWRTKRNGLRRNVCVALGNLADSRARPALQRAAADADPIVAEHARWALARLVGG